MVFGGTAPGGILNLVSKRPTEEPIGTFQSGVDSNGQVFTGIDIGGPLSEDGSVLYRMVTRGHFGDTATDHGTDNGVMFAPSLTWRPNDDTSLTMLALYQKDNSNQYNGFLPYEGTEVRAATGRIPRDLYIGNPDRDKFHRDQAMIGYEFEHEVTDDVTVRQNVRYTYQNQFQRGIYPFGYTDDSQEQLNRINFKTTPRVHL